MKVFLDNQPIDVNVKDYNNLEDLIYGVMTDFIPGNRLLVEVKVNDITFSERWPGEAKIIPIDKILKLDFYTEPLEKVASKMLDDLPKQIDMINKGLLDAAELYRVADEQEANLNFIKMIAALRDFITFITQLRKTNIINWEELNIDGMEIETHYEKLNKLTDEILDVQEDEDWILLADLIEYELKPIMEKWKEFLEQANNNLKKNL